ncbi:MAG: preprotein translocase subunit SecE [Candidatus Eremiobacteraeota bacterium]|nr:preprotein translocase subunit SecE [Candidatus Eremiobacteraeota bacterium]
MRPTGAPPPRPSARAAERAANAARVQTFFRGIVSEMRRVTWPSRQEWIAATILTIGLVISLAIYTYVVDELLTLIFGAVRH